MELSAKYVRTVWEKQSFSLAAKTLFISQPALSATVSKLEKQLGFKIFDRSTSPITLTVRGKIYMDYLDEIFENENLFQQRLNAIDESSSGSLTISGQMISAIHLLPLICGEFYRRFPKVNVSIDLSAPSEYAKKDVADLRFTYNPNPSLQDLSFLMHEELFVVLSKSHPLAPALAPLAISYEQIITKTVPDEKRIRDLSVFQAIPFIKKGRISDTNQRLALMMAEHLTSSYIIDNSIDIRYKMMRQGIGAALLPDLFLAASSKHHHDLCFFSLASPHAKRALYLYHRKDCAKTESMSRFISVAKEFCLRPNLLEQLSE